MFTNKAPYWTLHSICVAKCFKFPKLSLSLLMTVVHIICSCYSVTKYLTKKCYGPEHVFVFEFQILFVIWLTTSWHAGSVSLKPCMSANGSAPRAQTQCTPQLIPGFVESPNWCKTHFIHSTASVPIMHRHLSRLSFYS